MTVITGNRQLAARARDIADRAGRGTLDRQAGLCLAVCLAPPTALPQPCAPCTRSKQPEIRERAVQMLGKLTGGTVGGRRHHRCMEKSPAQSEFDRLAREALAGPFAGLGARESGQEMIAAMRRGDRPGAELALTGYLASVPFDTLPEAADKLGFMALALRDLALNLAEVAAEEPG